jgi:hypothetical protein
MRFIEYCDKNRIWLAIFPAHATHTLQPLDVSLFRPLSQAYTDELNKSIQESQGLTRIRKRDFFRLFWASWIIAFKEENILSAFKTTGLYPFNPDLVVRRLSRKRKVGLYLANPLYQLFQRTIGDGFGRLFLRL